MLDYIQRCNTLQSTSMPACTLCTLSVIVGLVLMIFLSLSMQSLEARPWLSSLWVGTVDSQYHVLGQILSLCPMLQNTPGAQSISWVWNLQFVALNCVKATHTQQATTDCLHHHTFACNRWIVFPPTSSHITSIQCQCHVINIHVVKYENN